MKALPIVLFIGLVFCLVMWLTPSNRDRELEELREQNEQIEARVKLKDLALSESLKREVALSLQYRRFKTVSDSATLVSEKYFKLYLHERKHRKTPILADSSYTHLIDSLFTGR
jgi:hypothetical protein